MDAAGPGGGSLGDLNAANRYTYAGDDPINEVDPSGASPQCIGWLVAALGATGGAAYAITEVLYALLAAILANPIDWPVVIGSGIIILFAAAAATGGDIASILYCLGVP